VAEESRAPLATRRGHWRWILPGLLGIAALALRYGNEVAIAFENPEPSVSIGTPERGELRFGKRLPSRGGNFRAYSDLGTLLGRNSVDGRVRETVLEAYADLAAASPQLRFVYGECGWPSGGSFRPHRTHQNGMAVDFFVPVRDEQDRSRRLPTHAFNRYGYDVEFDAHSRWHDYTIDYPAMVAHLRALDAAARRHNLRIGRVIFDDKLQRQLFVAEGGDGLAQRIPFSSGRSWVRHDEHYHVVFVPAG
jgi:penicillin-insensitive murein DD-endopeptidase